jgi:hypothetical protein
MEQKLSKKQFKGMAVRYAYLTDEIALAEHNDFNNAIIDELKTERRLIRNTLVADIKSRRTQNAETQITGRNKN